MIKRLYAIPEMGILTSMLILVAFFQLINPAFLSVGNVTGMFRAMSITGIVAVGLAFCLMGGTIDISVGAVVGLTSVAFSKAMVAGWPMALATILAIVVGCLAGFGNSVAIVRLNVSPFITTISTMYMYRSIAYVMTRGLSVYPLPPEVEKFGGMQPLGISWSFFIMLAIMVIMSVLLTKSVWGLCVRAIGSDTEIAKCNEVNVVSIRTSVLVLAGGMSGLGGVLVTGIVGSGQPTVGMGWELIAIVGCAIGGISLFGYYGSMVGLFLGLLTVQVITNGLIIIGIPPYVQGVALGIILVGSMIVDVKRRHILNVEQS